MPPAMADNLDIWAVDSQIASVRPARAGGRDPLRGQCQVGSLTGAVHLSNGNAGVLRRAQGGQKPPVEQKGKSSLDLDFQYLMHEVAKQLDLNPNRFPIFAALLGNHILPDEDLASFHWSLLGPEHPLASLKVRAHQLVLPPCDVVIKAVADYVRNIHDTSDLDAIAKDVFQHSQSRTDDKVIRFKRAVGYYSATSKPMPFHPPHYLARPNPFGMPGMVPPYVPPKVLY